MTEPRRWTFEDKPRLDKDGTEWYACDPYPTWYRWTENPRTLVTTDTYDIFPEAEDGVDYVVTPFPGWAETSDATSV